MKKLLGVVLAVAALVSVGCHLTDYPVITDARGDYSGVIRTGHDAYIIPTSQVATIWMDGSEELINMVYQNQYGDQKLRTRVNYDPTASVLFVNQFRYYCDWRFDDCQIAESWNPATGPDNALDFTGFPDCPGYRSLSLLITQGGRVGECGDGLFWHDKQALFGEFSSLATTTIRGETAYIVPINASNTSVELAVPGNVATMPMFGQINGFLTESFQLVIPVTANLRHTLRWMREFVADNGTQMDVTIEYGGLSGTVSLGVVAGGIDQNLARF